MNAKVQHVHLLFQSAGGFVGDGIALYNYFKTLPIELTVYNSGAVASIGVIAYLGAKTRNASKYSAFMIHRTQRNPATSTANMLKSLAESAAIDDHFGQPLSRAAQRLRQTPACKLIELEHNGKAVGWK